MISTSASARAVFDDVWRAATAAIAQPGGAPPSEYAWWWSQLQAADASSLVVRSLTIDSCAAVDRCIGTSVAGDCICYHY
jgi:hypothetical protein